MRYIILFFAVFTITHCSAQSDSSAIKEKVSFKLGAYYNSHLNYYGRTDSLKSSAIFPIAELWFNKNVYLTATPIFVINEAGFKYAGTVAIGGLRFAKEKKYIANLYAVKPFYVGGSQLVQSALKAQLAGSYTWVTKAINVTAGGDVKLSDNLDYGLTASIDRVIRFSLPKEAVFVIDPTIKLDAGTQEFTKTSYKRSGFLLFPGFQQEITDEVKKFSLLAIEFSAPIVVAKGKLQLIINPAYCLPQNLITIEERPDLSERGKNLFYVTTGLRVQL